MHFLISSSVDLELVLSIIAWASCFAVNKSIDWFNLSWLIADLISFNVEISVAWLIWFK
ncbi:hypothetical protein NWE61_05750 [Mycoplasmopsis felis]|uniref:hypothetical protein n=1 Tax=Mycoplasmopsis felis TaxID=33923 RepID=UPI0021DF5AC5|nr:hypothetical protein [Mycoplasmopsis felis]MCU9934578.1 hypothetical protein [Mycoplasmopsis felis]